MYSMPVWIHDAPCVSLCVYACDISAMVPTTQQKILQSNCGTTDLRFSFWDKLSIIPIESPVIFLLGEIDCRDGILRSVQKAC